METKMSKPTIHLSYIETSGSRTAVVCADFNNPNVAHMVKNKYIQPVDCEKCKKIHQLLGGVVSRPSRKLLDRIKHHRVVMKHDFNIDVFSKAETAGDKFERGVIILIADVLEGKYIDEA